MPLKLIKSWGHGGQPTKRWRNVPSTESVAHIGCTAGGQLMRMSCLAHNSDNIFWKICSKQQIEKIFFSFDIFFFSIMLEQDYCIVTLQFSWYHDALYIYNNENRAGLKNEGLPIPLEARLLVGTKSVKLRLNLILCLGSARPSI